MPETETQYTKRELIPDEKTKQKWREEWEAEWKEKNMEFAEKSKDQDEKQSDSDSKEDEGEETVDTALRKKRSMDNGWNYSAYKFVSLCCCPLYCFLSIMLVLLYLFVI